MTDKPGKRIPLPPNRREHPRVELVATVEVAAGSEVMLLTAKNLSAGGVFLEGRPADYPALRRGTAVNMTIAMEATETPRPGAPPPPPLVARVHGKIVRAADDGFGVVLVDVTAAELHKVHALIAKAGG